MVRKFNILVFIFSIAHFAWADKSVKNNYTGGWTTNSSWTGGTAPNTSSLPSPSNENYTINGYINVGSYGSNQDLTFSANSDAYTITINDTLVVYGNVDFANKAMNLSIGNGGFLIIIGNLTMNNKIDVATNGQIIVSGNFDKNGSQGTYSGTGNVYAGSYTGDASSLVPNTQEKNAGSDLQADYPTIYSFVSQSGQGLLPIKVMGFKAENIGKVVALSWITTYEHNFDFFTVERSENGMVFSAIGNLQGTGESMESRKYYFEDENPLNGLSYYRLISVDLDGTSENHGMIVIQKIIQGNFFNVYPNPSDGLHVNIDNKFSNDQIVRIINISNQEVSRCTLNPGINQVYFKKMLLPGQYFICPETLNGSTPVRFIVK